MSNRKYRIAEVLCKELKQIFTGCHNEDLDIYSSSLQSPVPFVLTIYSEPLQKAYSGLFQLPSSYSHMLLTMAKAVLSLTLSLASTKVKSPFIKMGENDATRIGIILNFKIETKYITKAKAMQS